MITKTVEQCIKELKSCSENLSEERNKLHDLMYEIKYLLEDKDEDIAKLDEVIDSLSKYV
jgi:archaellum component FlaC